MKNHIICTHHGMFFLKGVPLTPRESDVVALAISGYTSKMISTLLGISSRTVDVHMHSIHLKLNVFSRPGLFEACLVESKLALFQDHIKCLHRRRRLYEIFASVAKNKKTLPSIAIVSPSISSQAILSMYLFHAGFSVEFYECVPDFLARTHTSEITLYDSLWTPQTLGLHDESQAIKIIFDEEASQKTHEKSLCIIWKGGPHYEKSLLELLKMIVPDLSVESISSERCETAFFNQESLYNKSSVQAQKVFDLWNVPPQNGCFTERQAIKEHIDRLLGLPNPLVLLACVGLGGSGKTQATLHYVHTTQTPYTMKVWMNAETQALLLKTYAQLASTLGYDKRSSHSEDAVAYVHTWFENHPGWLLVFDNVVYVKDIMYFLPRSGGHVMITSRNKRWPANFDVLEIGSMTEEEGFETLTRLSHGVEKGEQEKEAKKQLAKILNYLPLALAQAASYVAVNHISFNEYLQLFKNHPVALLQENSLEIYGAGIPVEVTLSLSLQRILEKYHLKGDLPIGLELLIVCTFLPSDKLCKETLLRWLEIRFPKLHNNEIRLHTHLGIMSNQFLFHADGDTLVIHRLVQAVLRHTLFTTFEKGETLYGIMDISWFKKLMHFLVYDPYFHAPNCCGYADYFKNFEPLDSNEVETIFWFYRMAASLFWQERCEEFKQIVDALGSYIHNNSCSVIAPCMLGKVYMYYGDYCMQNKNKEKAENWYKKALENYSNADLSSIHVLKRTTLTLIMLYDKVSICCTQYSHRHTTELNEKERQEIEDLLAKLKNFPKISSEISHVAWHTLWACRLKNLLGLFSEVLDDLSPHLELFNKLHIHRSRLLFYLTLATAHMKNGCINEAEENLEAANVLAKQRGWIQTVDCLKQAKAFLHNPSKNSLFKFSDFSQIYWVH